MAKTKRTKSQMWWGPANGHLSQKVRVRGPLFGPIFDDEWIQDETWYYDFGPIITIGSMVAKKTRNGAMDRMLTRAKEMHKIIIIVNPINRWLTDALLRRGFHQGSVLTDAPEDPVPTSMALIWFPLNQQQWDAGIFFDDLGYVPIH